MFWQKWWFWVVVLGFAFPVFGDQLKAIISAWRGDSDRVKELREEIVELRHELNRVKAKNKAYEMQKEINQEYREKLRQRSSGQEVAVLGFCDLVGFTEFLTKVGDEKAKEFLDAYNNLVRSTLEKFDGTEIKQLGDGFLFSFSSSQKSIEASVEIRDGIEEINSIHGTNLSIRIGLHAGEVIRDSGDVIGSAVNMTERVMQHASKGEIVASKTFREIIGTGSEFDFTDAGEKKLKGFSEPRKIYSIGVNGDEE